MGFKILKQEAKDPEYSDYIKRKIDLAAEDGVVYELEDEDKRIDALHKDPNLYSEKRLLTLDRVRVGNKQYLVAGVEYAFYNINTSIYADKYIDYVGKTVRPVKSQGGLSGQVTVTQQGMYRYDMEFAPQKVDSIISEFQGVEPVEYRFYQATTNLLRTAQPVEVKRKEFFRDATWEELQIGKEKTYTSSSLNKLNTMRKEIDYNERQQYGGDVTPAESKTDNIQRHSVKGIEPDNTDKTVTEKQEVEISIKNEPPVTKKQQHNNAAGTAK